jgi:hypothetical protein
MFLKYETAAKEYIAVNPVNVTAIRDFGNDTTEIILNGGTKVYVKKSYVEVLGDMNGAQN